MTTKWGQDPSSGGEEMQPNSMAEMPLYSEDAEVTEEISDGPVGSRTAALAEPVPIGRIPLERVKYWFESAWRVMRESPVDFVMAQLLVCLGTILSLGFLIGPLTAGYYRYTLMRLRGEDAEHKELFSAFSADAFVGTFVAGVGYLAAFVLVGSAFSALGFLIGHIPGVGSPIGFVIRFTGTVILVGGYGFWSFLPALIHERGLQNKVAALTLGEAWRGDMLGGSLLGLAVGVAPFVGGVVVGLGILLGGPIGMLVGAQAYRDVFDGERVQGVPGTLA